LRLRSAPSRPAEVARTKLLVHHAAKAACVPSFGLMRTVADYTSLPRSRPQPARRACPVSTAQAAFTPRWSPFSTFPPTPREIEHARALVQQRNIYLIPFPDRSEFAAMSFPLSDYRVSGLDSIQFDLGSV
jgi:hypothetical protein